MDADNTLGCVYKGQNDERSRAVSMFIRTVGYTNCGAGADAFEERGYISWEMNDFVPPLWFVVVWFG
jgi:hypothetical protein